MAIYAYCLVRLDPDESWPILEGIGGRPVFPYRCGKYAMLLSRFSRNVSFTPRSIVEHGQVIARVFETHTVLPLRFGTFFQSERQVEQMIRENQSGLLETFCRLRGKAEMRLKLSFLSDAGDISRLKKRPQKTRSPRSARSSSGESAADPRAQEIAEQLASRLREMFRPLDDQVTCRQLQSREVVVDCAHLIESENVESYRQICDVASKRVKDCSIRMSGPWPPYHFLPASVRIPAASLRPMKMARNRSAAAAR